MELDLISINVDEKGKEKEGKEKRRSKRTEKRDESDEFAIPSIVPTTEQRKLKIDRVVYEIFSTFGGPIRALCYVGPNSSVSNSSNTKNEDKNESSVIASNQEQILYTGAHPSKTIKKWDIKTGQLIASLNGHLDDIVTFCYNDSFLFSGSLDKTIRQWDLKSGQCVRVYKGHKKPVTCVVLSDGNLYSSSQDLSIIQWNTQTGEIVREFVGHNSFVNSLCIHEGHLFSASDDSTIKIWNLESGKVIGELKQHRSIVNDITIAEDTLISCSDDRTIIQWDLKTHKVKRVFAGHASAVLCVRYFDGKLYSGSKDTTVRQWDLKTDKYIEFQGHEDTVTNMAIVNGTLYTGARDKSIRKWNIKQVESVKVLEGHRSEVNKMITNGDFLFSASYDYSIRQWRLKDGSFVREYTGHKDDVDALCIWKNFLFTGSTDKTIRQWDIQTGEHIAKWKAHKEVVSSLAVENGMLVSGSRDCLIKVWDIETRDCILEINNEYIVTGILLNNGYIFAASYSFNINQYSIKNGEKLQEFAGHADLITEMQIYQGNLYSSSKDGSLRKWDLETGKSEVLIANEQAITTFHLANNLVFYASEDLSNNITVYDKDTIVTELHQHNLNVSSLCLSDWMLYSGSRDFTIVQWDLQLLMAPRPFYSAMNVDLIYNEIKKKSKLISFSDPFHRNLISFCARFGEPKIMETLLKQLGQTMDDVNKLGESPLFIAMKEERWAFIKGIPKPLVYRDPEALNLQSSTLHGSIRIAKPNPPSYHMIVNLLQNKISSQDYRFLDEAYRLLLRKSLWVEVFKVGLDDQKLLNYLENNNWDINAQESNGETLLHFASSQGNVKAVEMLCNKKGIRINIRDLAGRTPLHESLGEVVTTLHKRLEFRKKMDRLSCAQLLIGQEELAKKPELLSPDIDGKTPYDFALRRHKEAIVDLGIPRNEITEKEDIQRAKIYFQKTSQILNDIHTDSEVRRMRNRFALSVFLKQASHFIIFLVLVGVVAFHNTSQNNQQSSYYFTEGIKNVFTDSYYALPAPNQYKDINEISEVWDFIQGPLLDGLYSNPFMDINGTEWSNRTGFVSSYNKIVGLPRLRQIRMKPNSCDVVSEFESEVPFCYSDKFEEDKTPFGPNNSFVWSENLEEDRVWGKLDSFFPKSGFVQDLSVSYNESATLIQNLKNNNWIDRGTRAIFMSFTLYNPNINELAAIHLVIEFLPSASILPYYRILSFDLFKYTNPDDIGISVLEILIIFYVLIEFFIVQLKELWIAVKKRRLVDFFTEGWNYLEWAIVLVMIIIIVYRFKFLALTASAEIPPNPIRYVNYRSLAYALSQERDFWSIFVFLCIIRFLKLLRIPPLTGPIVQSFLDTLRYKTSVTYLVLFLLILWSFSFSYNIAFADDIYEYRNIGQSFLSLLRTLFGDFDYDNLVDSHRILGPILFILFTVVGAVFLMNLLIAILSEIYITVQKKNETAWLRFITKLLMKRGGAQTYDGLIAIPIVGLFRLLSKCYKRYIKFRGKDIIQQYEANQNVNATVWFSESEMDQLAETAGTSALLKKQSRTEDLEDKLEDLETKLEALTTSFDQRMNKLESILQNQILTKKTEPNEM